MRRSTSLKVSNKHLIYTTPILRYLSLLVDTFAKETVRPRADFEADLTRMKEMALEAKGSMVMFVAAKEEAQREALLSTPAHTIPLPSRPFQQLVGAQREKNRRDRHYRERLQRERKIEQQRTERREKDLDRAMNMKQSNLSKHQKGKRSMTSLLRTIRPSSIAWGSDRTLARTRTASELDFRPDGKPSLVLSLNDATTKLLKSIDRPYVFQLTTEDGATWHLQTMTAQELEKWMQQISSASRKRSTYIQPTGPARLPYADMPNLSARPGAGQFG